MNPADEIRATIEVLETDGWTKGTTLNPRGERCWIGARAKVRCLDVALIYTLDRLTTDEVDAAFVAAASTLFPERLFSRSWAFNDMTATTWEDMQLVAKHAANDLELADEG